MTQINSLLIANRGEIACRIIRTARSLGIRTIAVCSDADVGAPHTILADDVIHIGPSNASESYLSFERILEAARATSADAVHPGYGFLSENAEFAEAVEVAGIVFIGPSPHAIRVMGDKARAKRAMIEAGVPCVPGYQDEDQENSTLLSAASKIGFPLMVKAAAGGGGKGMRLVTHEKELLDSLELARAEAESAFGSGELILERAVLNARHVEIQVFGDSSGNFVHLGERDCSVQRRHQKIIEESPCPVMTPRLRKAMGEAAIAAAAAVNYAGAGTVEFLLGEDNEFYFLEMNTRLQVEHPVTEMVTGLDLVALQIHIAEGNDLSISQEDVCLSGHAIEVRLYAEDPANDFLPSAGRVHQFSVPKGKGIRVDSGVETGCEVSPYYDPMVAKIIAHGATREDTRRKIIDVLRKTALMGVKSNREFLIQILRDQTFAEGLATTTYISSELSSTEISDPFPTQKELAVAATLFHEVRKHHALQRAPEICDELLNWGSSGSLKSTYVFSQGDEPARIVTVLSHGCSALRCEIEGEKFCIEPHAVSEHGALLRVNGIGTQVAFVLVRANTLEISMDERSFSVVELSGGGLTSDEEAGSGVVKAPMHGKIVSLNVAQGDLVSKGDKVAVLEAMKMQHEIVAEIDGLVDEVPTEESTSVALDDVILIISPIAET